MLRVGKGIDLPLLRAEEFLVVILIQPAVTLRLGRDHRQAAVSLDKSEDSNAKDIQDAFSPAKAAGFQEEPKPTSIDELDNGVIFNTGKDTGSSQIKREPIRLNDDSKGKKFDFSDIE